MTANCFTPHATSQTVLKPSITIVVSPREHSGATQQFLESIYNHTKMPFELVYIDAGSPKHIQKYLTHAAAEYNFTLLRSEHFLMPNQSRNLGLSQVTTDYILFIANDVYVTPNWLERLWQCAQETHADAVCPLACAGTPLHESIRLAHGEAPADTQGKTIPPGPDQPLAHPNQSDSASQPQGTRWDSKTAELNCLLVKRNVFEQIGYFDPRLLGMQADMDFCFSLSRINGSIVCESTSLVTPVLQKPDNWLDWSYFMLCCSDAWERESLMHFQQKWDLGINNDFQQCYDQLGQRRHQTFLYPLLRWLTRDHISPSVEQQAIGLDHWLNKLLTDRHARSSYDAMGTVVHTAVPLTEAATAQPTAVANAMP